MAQSQSISDFAQQADMSQIIRGHFGIEVVSLEDGRQGVRLLNALEDELVVHHLNGHQVAEFVEQSVATS